ncbi:hypothetical protein BASA60_004288 [Batrachochytrium salamandrivorans]|nr:hypothetical protein BASA60_004288 [Batrachochytrium salamandrivorans]
MAQLNATKHRLQETEAANEEWRSGASAIYANIRQLALTLAHSHQACPHTDVHAEQVSPDSISSQFRLPSSLGNLAWSPILTFQPSLCIQHQCTKW